MRDWGDNGKLIVILIIIMVAQWGAIVDLYTRPFQLPQGQGGNPANYYFCLDLPNLLCLQNGNSGAVSGTNSTLCTSGNTNCVTTQYSLNFAPKASGTNTAGSGIAAGKFNCTSVTSGPITLSATHVIQIIGFIELANTNVTNQVYLIQLQMGTTAPSQTFGIGHCATGGTVLTTVEFQTPTIGAAAIYGTSFNFAPSKTAGTYYTWVDIEGITTNSLVNFKGSQSSLTMQAQI